ncbi:BON domain-containing protein [Moraxella sp. Tifton1]|uniref:BON domain-containing protein n=1 Tax=Moraxella oculi TaxID=2940516 RepID=UPI002010CC03|nr:BON domain-containing protein [Moraxella sp. Tifton1]MCL1623702.1 BON domain-containing protein [Moraxella sp. Tifton1]
MKQLASAAMLGVLMTLTACGTLGNTAQSVDFADMGRSLPERISDESIEFTARKQLSYIAGVNENTVRIAIDSFHREVLLTGEVPNETVKTDIEAMVKSMKDVTAVYNYLTIAQTPKSQSHTVHENYLKSKINARLMAQQGIKASQYKIVVRDRTAYVMGHMTPIQQGYVLDAIQHTAGMASAVTLTTLVNDDVSVGAKIHPNPTQPSSSNGVIDGGGVYQAKPYALQEIYVPNATTNAPANIEPVYTPVGMGKSTSGYVQLYQGTNTP